jgi:Phytanoyl-CoA dioxygenase (PhyH)
MKFLASRLYRHFRDRGYHVFRDAFPVEEIANIASMARLVSKFEGELHRQDGRFSTNEFFPDTELVRNPLLHPHISLPGPLAPLATALRSLVTSPVLADHLRELDGERHYIIHQVLLFFAAQTTELHLDSWSLDTMPLGRSHTVWIPLQDMDHGSGLPAVIPWRLGEVIREEALGLMPKGGDPREERYENYHRALRTKLLSGSPEIATSLLRVGDFMVWSSLTPHFSLPPRHFPAERLSLQVLIRPSRLRWGDFMEQPYGPTSVQLSKVSDRFSIRVMD